MLKPAGIRKVSCYCIYNFKSLIILHVLPKYIDVLGITETLLWLPRSQYEAEGQTYGQEVNIFNYTSVGFSYYTALATAPNSKYIHNLMDF